MTFKILDQYNLINGVTDSSLGSINPFTNFELPKAGRKKVLTKSDSYFNSERKIIKFLKNLGFQNISEKDLVFADQIHGFDIHICQKGDSGSIRLSVDGLASNHPGQILVIKTADCVPILIYEPNKKVVAAIHAGRKSLSQNIISKSISKMRKSYGIMPEKCVVALGPHIRKCHYFLRKKALENLKNTKWEKYFISRAKIYFDITSAVLDELIHSGIPKENIEDSQICTYCQYKKYFSARKYEVNPAIYQEKFSCFANIIGLPRKNSPAGEYECGLIKLLIFLFFRPMEPTDLGINPKSINQ